MSDTHGYIDDEILHYVKNVDEVWHAGDIGNQDVVNKISELKPLRAVFGNIDDYKIRSEFPEILDFLINDFHVVMTHIGGYPKKYSPFIKKYFNQNPYPNLFICGHSHILKIIFDKENNLLHMNPGAIGKHGFQQIRTMIRFEIINSKIENVEIIEFKK